MKQDLDRYVPQRVSAALAARWHPRAAIEPRPFDGVAMVVDIAGSSALAERFARSGAAGAEELSVILDRYFGCMADIAIAHGGDVVDFVGDAIVVIWNVGKEPGIALAMAAQCGLALQAAVPALAAASGTALTQRVGIDAGPMFELELGGLGSRWHCLTAGTPIRDAARACHHAAPGEVVATRRLWTTLGTYCDGYPTASGCVRLDRVSAPQALPIGTPGGDKADEAALSAYLPQPLLERLRAGGSRWFGEFREITTLFLGLPQLDFENPNAAAVLQFTTERVQRAHARYGGTLVGPSMDDKGITLLSAFGLPMMAHEDDGERAVHAALAVCADLAEQHIPCAVGMTTGRAFYGDIGGTHRRHVGIMGVPVNTAAALMVAAGHGILCDEPTRRAAERAFDFEEQAPVATKGRAELLRTWRPRAQRQQAPRRFTGALIGRAAERRRIDEQIEVLARRNGGTVLLRGEAGIGKSRLLAHAAAEAGARGIRVLACSGTAIESGTPYFPWRHLLARLLLGDGVLDPAKARTEVRRMLAAEEQLLPWLPLLNDLAPLGFRENEITRQIAGSSRASSLQALLRALLARSAADAPILVLADDLHWFDGASAAALASATRTLPGVLLLAASRPLDASAPAELIELVEQAGAFHIELDVLSRAGVELLICEKLAATTVASSIVDFVHSRTGGNPFYVEELALAVRGAGLIEVQAGNVRLAQGKAAEALQALPTSLRAVIVSRFDALSTLEQLSLKIAAVIGREFSLPMVRELHPQAGDADLEGVLRTLLREDIVRRAPPAGRGEYAFKHAILQDIVYDQLPFALRRELHGAAAAWIERREAGQLEPYYAELALHWERAERAERAIDYLEKAAQFALGRYANREALRHVIRAMELAERAGVTMDERRVAKCEALLGEAHHGLFEYASALKHFKRALSLAGRAVPERGAARALAIFVETAAQAAARTGLFPRAAEERRTDLQWSSQIYERLAEIAYFDNRPADLLHATLASLNLAERAGAARETVEGYAALSIGLQQARAPKLSRYYNRRSIAVAESAGSLSDVAYAHLVNCVFQATQGGWPELERSHARAAEIYRQLGAGVRWHQTRSVYYTSLVIRGLLEESGRELDEVRATIGHDTPPPVRSWVSAASTVLALERGLPLDDLLRELETLEGVGLHRADLLQCMGLAAHAQLKQGRLEEALRRADEALALLETAVPTAWHLLPGLAGIAEVFLAAANADRASRIIGAKATRACRLLQRYSRSTPISTPRAAVLAGRDAWLRGHSRRARTLWHFAEARAAALDMPRDRAAAARELAQGVIPNGLSETAH